MREISLTFGYFLIDYNRNEVVNDDILPNIELSLIYLNAVDALVIDLLFFKDLFEEFTVLADAIESSSQKIIVSACFRDISFSNDISFRRITASNHYLLILKKF